MGTLLLAFFMLSGQTQAPSVTIAPTTFSEAYFAQLDKANGIFNTYIKTGCNSPNYMATEDQLHRDYLTLAALAQQIKKQEPDWMLQDRELESFIGFKVLLRDSVNNQHNCATKGDPTT